jgi:hypothetical protein
MAVMGMEEGMAGMAGMEVMRRWRRGGGFSVY